MWRRVSSRWSFRKVERITTNDTLHKTGGSQMFGDLIPILTLLSTLGCGLMAGFFFAFSVCV